MSEENIDDILTLVIGKSLATDDWWMYLLYYSLFPVLISIMYLAMANSRSQKFFAKMGKWNLIAQGIIFLIIALILDAIVRIIHNHIILIPSE